MRTSTRRGAAVLDAFTGDSNLWGLDFVWKWAPNGNTVDRNFRFQAEYMHRTEDGTLAFDTAGRDLSGAYRSSQSGWYLQGAYQFMPRWRAGLRYEQLDSGHAAIGLVRTRALSAADFPRLAPNQPQRSTAMIDFSPSEFSRLRLQYRPRRSPLQRGGQPAHPPVHHEPGRSWRAQILGAHT